MTIQETVMKRASAILVMVLLSFAPEQFAADRLPTQLSDGEFWKMIQDFSEPNGEFPYENFVSNESHYQTVLPELKRKIQPGGVYIGVAPEQNFTYAAVIQPKISSTRLRILRLVSYPGGGVRSQLNKKTSKNAWESRTRARSIVEEVPKSGVEMVVVKICLGQRELKLQASRIGAAQREIDRGSNRIGQVRVAKVHL